MSIFRFIVIHVFYFLFLFISYLSATNYYVATSYGDDNNNGTSIATPYKTIGKAASVMSSGDKCYIRQGRYHETITIDDLDGSSGSAIVFTNYNNERVGTGVYLVFSTDENGYEKAVSKILFIK